MRSTVGHYMLVEPCCGRSCPFEPIHLTAIVKAHTSHSDNGGAPLLKSYPIPLASDDNIAYCYLQAHLIVYRA